MSCTSSTTQSSLSSIAARTLWLCTRYDAMPEAASPKAETNSMQTTMRERTERIRRRDGAGATEDMNPASDVSPIWGVKSEGCGRNAHPCFGGFGECLRVFGPCVTT